jgi:alanyl aminopeptidase
MRRVSPVIALLGLAACAELAGPGGTPAPVPTATAPATAKLPPAPEPPAAREDGRLPATVTPQRYALDLRIDPGQPRFSGRTSIQVDVPQPTWHVVLHARDMSVSRAFARVGQSEIPATLTSRNAHDGAQPEELVLSFVQPLPVGQAVLVLTYDAPFAGDLAGLYRVEENGAFYAYTQFENTDARRAFPCFDEPGFKTAYDLTITAPRGQRVLANSPEHGQEDAPDGMVVHRFETSRPLPSYLVAFAVGDFDVVQGQATPFPIRAVTTKGKGGLTSLALEAAVTLIAIEGEYFGVRYPYDKLDIVAVPDFAAGAMENPGLVTFRDVLLLLDPRHATTAMKREQALTIAHEFAHQWFGDLVTMKWWNDIWLNEGFATWAEARMVDAWQPAFGATVDQISSVQYVMDTDALTTTRAVREPTRSTSDVMESFDGITYEKGAAVLRMLERWLGADTFQRGVQRYLHDNAWGNAGADDLFRAMEFVSTQKVGELARGFLDQTGVPSVQASWKCGGKGGNKLELRQSEWRPLGEADHPVRRWTLPVCVATEGQKNSACFTLGAEPITRDLGPTCPGWVYPNADGAGYYRFLLDRTQLLALARGAPTLPPADRLGLVSNAWAGVRQGALEPSALLDILPMMDAETNHYVVEQIASAVRNLDDSMVDDADRAAFQRYVAARFAGKKAALGWEPTRGARKEDDDRVLERRVVLRAMGEAYDKATLDEAEKYAQKWLRDPSSVAGDTAAIAVPLASMRAGQARLDELRAAAKAPLSPEDHVLAIRAMAAFDDPVTLRKALDLALDGELRASELRYLIGTTGDPVRQGMLYRRASVPVLYAWVKEHWDRIRALVPTEERDMLVAPAGRLCTVADRDDAKAFFGPATQGLEGTKRWLDEALEEAGLCAALREHGSAAVERYFRHR